jgi:predicted nuclease of predicted toxin-antitoxin system
MPQLLLDSNLSFKIKRFVRKQFPQTFHISDFFKKPTSDLQIWHLAQKNNYIIVTYDEDFNDIQTLRGFPPKIIWLRFGNQTNLYVANKIILYRQQIEQLNESDELGILEIY